MARNGHIPLLGLKITPKISFLFPVSHRIWIYVNWTHVWLTWPLCCVCAETATILLLVYNFTTDLSCSFCYEWDCLAIEPYFRYFSNANFLLRLQKTATVLAPIQFLTPNLNLPWDYSIWQRISVELPPRFMHIWAKNSSLFLWGRIMAMFADLSHDHCFSLIAKHMSRQLTTDLLRMLSPL